MGLTLTPTPTLTLALTLTLTLSLSLPQVDGDRRLATLPSITDDYLDSLMGNPFATHMPPALPAPSPEKQRTYEDPSFQEAFFAARAKV